MEFFTIEAVAKILGVNPRTVRRYIEKGQLRGERVGGSWRVSEAALKEMFNHPEFKEKVSSGFVQKSENMQELYMQGKHRLQQNSSPVMTVFVYNQQTEYWVQAKSAVWLAKLNKLGETAQFDFALSGGEHGLYQLVLIAPFDLAATMLNELNSIRQSHEDN